MAPFIDIKLGINQKLIAVMTTVSLVLFSTIGLIDWARISHSLEQDLANKTFLEAKALEIALASGPNLLGGDAAFNAIQKTMFSNPNLKAVLVSIPTATGYGVVVASEPAAIRQTKAEMVHQVFVDGVERYTIRQFDDGENVMVAATPLFVARVPKGVVELHVSMTTSRKEAFEQIVRDAFVLLFFAIVLSISLFIATKKAVIDPVKQVNNEIQSYAETGEVPPKLEEGGDELVDLSRNFREMAARIKEAHEKQRQTNRLQAIGQLTGGVAHDFNNLLQVIQGNAELLNEVSAEEERKQLTQEVINASRRGRDLTSQLLSYARKHPSASKPVDIKQLGKDLVSLLERTLPETYCISWVDNDVPYALADVSQLQSAILNLVLNARDAMPTGGKIVVEAKLMHIGQQDLSDDFDAEPGDFIELSVSDSGSGIEPDTMQRIFEPFFTTKSVGDGHGLGLSMVYGFVQQSRGQISIRTSRQQGTTIFIYLPCAELQ